MNTEYLQHDLKQSFLLIVTQERRLFAGLLGGMILYALWVGATAAAIEQFATFANVSTALDPWTSDTTGLAVAGLLLWVILPAAVMGIGIDRAITNSHGHLAKPYRLRHPATLLVAPLCVVLAGAVIAVFLEGEYRAAWLALLLGAVFFHIRLLPYAYRVFSVSNPLSVTVSLVVTGVVVSAALLVEGAIAAGQRTFVDAVGAGLATVLGVESLAGLGGTTSVFGVNVPSVLGVAVATPLVLGSLYLLFQNVIGIINRTRSPTVARTEIRTGQRYPEFARPTVAPSERTQIPTTNSETSQTTRSTTRDEQAVSEEKPAASVESQGEEPEGEKPTVDSEQVEAGAESGTEGDHSETDDESEGDDEPVDDVSHTRVFRPPSDDSE